MMNGCNRHFNPAWVSEYSWLHCSPECDGIFFAKHVLYLGLVSSYLPNWDCLFLLNFQNGQRNHKRLLVMQTVNTTLIL